MFKVIWDDQAIDDLGNLDYVIAEKIKAKVENYLSHDPKNLGKPLGNIYGKLHRYRYGDYRVIYKILSQENAIVALKVGHRSDIY